MLKEFIDRIIDLSTPWVAEIDGVKFSDRQLVPQYPPQIKTLGVSTLSGLVRYLKSDEARKLNRALYIRVASSTDVTLFTAADISGRHNSLVQADFKPFTHFRFGDYMNPEAFIIAIKQNAVRTGLPGDHYDQVLQLVSSISVEHLDTLKDNGISQEVATRRGVEVGTQVVPAFLTLVFRRSFPEVNEIPSEFFLRIRAQGQNPTVALFETTFDDWEMKAKTEIVAWLRTATEDDPALNLTILE